MQTRRRFIASMTAFVASIPFVGKAFAEKTPSTTYYSDYPSGKAESGTMSMPKEEFPRGEIACRYRWNPVTQKSQQVGQCPADPQPTDQWYLHESCVEVPRYINDNEFVDTRHTTWRRINEKANLPNRN